MTSTTAAHVTDAPARRYRRFSPRRTRLGRWSARHHAGRRLAIVVLALVGATIGLLIGGHVDHRVGPVDASFHLRLTGGDTRVVVPPLGTLEIADHAGPLQLDATVIEVRADAVRRLVAGYPQSLDALDGIVSRDVHDALVSLLVRSAAAALVGALLLAGLVFRRVRATLAALVVSAAALGGTGGYAWATFRPSAISEPRFTGLLASAPAAVGDVQDIASNFTKYRQEIAKLVGNVSKLYGVTAALPAMPADGSTIRVLWVADIHDNPEAFDVMRSVARQFDVDAVIDSGDITDHGTALENNLLKPIRDLGVPYAWVKGNHDSDVTVRAMERTPNVTVLDGQVAKIAGLEMTGVGDPRFTPDKETHSTTAGEARLVLAAGDRLAHDIDNEQPHADLAVVHDPITADPVFGHVPLVLAGHLHHRDHSYRDGTLLLVQGSTGGAGLRALDHQQPTPVDLSVLYFSRSTHKLVAYDDITVGGLGLTSAQIDRHAADSVIKSADKPKPPPSPSPSPSQSLSASASASASVTPTAAAGAPASSPPVSASASGSGPSPPKP